MADNIAAGRVLWVCLGPRGQYRKRPAIALEAPNADGKVHVVVGSRQHAEDESLEMALPWHASGQCRTQLREATFLDLGWRLEIEVADIRAIGGVLPGRTLVELQRRLRSFIPAANPS